MASQLSDSQKIRQLIRTSEAARSVLGAEIRTLKHRLDVPARMKESLRSHPTGWLGGSMVAGLASSLLFRRKAKREKTKRKGIAGLAFTLGVAAARPAIQMWASGKLKDYLASKLGQEPLDDISARRPRHVAPF